MKRINLIVAKYIKEKGYPQNNVLEIYREDGSYLYTGGILSLENTNYIKIATYLDIWLWLWKEKKIRIQLEGEYCTAWSEEEEAFIYQTYYEDMTEPEEAIATAIDYLVKHELIK